MLFYDKLLQQDVIINVVFNLFWDFSYDWRIFGVEIFYNCLFIKFFAFFFTFLYKVYYTFFASSNACAREAS